MVVTAFPYSLRVTDTVDGLPNATEETSEDSVKVPVAVARSE